MRRRIAALSCCLSLLHVSIAAADDTAAARTSSLTVAVVKDAPQSGPIRNASLDRNTVTTYIGETRSSHSAQESDGGGGSWVERHPVWTGAILGFSTGFVLAYLATDNGDDGRMFKYMNPGAAGMVWGGVCAGVGALAGWGIGRNRDD